MQNENHGGKVLRFMVHLYIFVELGQRKYKYNVWRMGGFMKDMMWMSMDLDSILNCHALPKFVLIIATSLLLSFHIYKSLRYVKVNSLG